MTQKAHILKRLQRGRTVSPLQALNEYGCFRLAARIHELRSEGYKIDVDTKLGYAIYKMAPYSRGMGMKL